MSFIKYTFNILPCFKDYGNCGFAIYFTTASKQEKDYALLLSFVGQARLQFAGLHSLFLLCGVSWLK